MVNPKVPFYFGLFLTIASLFASGTIHLSGLVPADVIPYVTGWSSVIVAVGTAIQTAMSGYASVGVGPLAPPPTPAEADRIKAEAIKAASK
jgi:hypothetical protein